MDSDDAQQPSGLSEPTGQLLKRAREQKGLSVSAVADAQHLRPAIIQAIEDGHYEQIDSELFLKGYVRTYARQVDLDPDAVIATLDEELEPLRQQKVQAEEANPLIDIERRRRRKRRVAKFLLLLLAIAVIAFLALRFIGELDGITGGTAEPTASSESDVSAQPEPSEETVSVDDTVDTELAEPGTEEEADRLSAPVDEASIVEDNSELAELPEDPQVNEQVSGSPAPTVEDDSAPAAQPAVDEIDESQVPVVTSEPEPAFQESAQPTAAVGSARLEMTFSDECWVQVTDSAGNRLVGSLQRDGDRINVSGRLPIDVVVGAVDAIESIRFDGQPIDLSGYRVVNNRAEFSLDI
ncbi:RodZ domain-containing protein [uncultured Marinobacter sp.]|uniref:RodZ domain-containing protein n=1 Tax=uncultured Marinobacter sp. TaxID=187379 RepID=UPI002585E062|nr:RodZ domain-containing protein [uncultured Marinobacter sp.]